MATPTIAQLKTYYCLYEFLTSLLAIKTYKISYFVGSIAVGIYLVGNKTLFVEIEHLKLIDEVGR